MSDVAAVPGPYFAEPPRRVAFAAAPTVLAQECLARLVERHGSVPLEEADAIVALGGDGFMLETLHLLLARV